MASNGDAPPIISPVIAPGSDINPTVFALSSTGDSAITSALFTCCSVACRGVAPSASAVSTYPNINTPHLNCLDIQLTGAKYIFVCLNLAQNGLLAPQFFRVQLVFQFGKS